MDDLRSHFSERVPVATPQCAGNRRADLIEVRDVPGEDPWDPELLGSRPRPCHS
ncbi:hypothetical protein [Streptosporangium lutulentum]|uniref:Uncharacterized protein n=1 Tax=Streptosporangium lutulentum TaxID=1461250 RepID=A0ABT9Q5R5_9ACTN|nr:hypothetical protein [Streptosporangium lutulentum]MDP9842078.1 hypothetical protein [Streptosporangium lutulentum]